MKPILSQLLGILALSLAPAFGNPIQVWNFTGTCTDCPGTGTGTLTVEQTAFTFTYSSPWISYTMGNATLRLGNVVQSPGSAINITPSTSVRITQIPVTVQSNGGTNGPYQNPLPPGSNVLTTYGFYFQSANGGNWSTGENIPSDFGTGGTWALGSSAPSNVPEPSTFALLASAAVACGFARRRWAR